MKSPLPESQCTHVQVFTAVCSQRLYGSEAHAMNPPSQSPRVCMCEFSQRAAYKGSEALRVRGMSLRAMPMWCTGGLLCA